MTKEQKAQRRKERRQAKKNGVTLPPLQTGAPRQYRSELPVYDSMQQCEGATGVPVSVLKHANKSGCQFVRGGRVHFSEFVRWFFGRGDGADGEAEINWSVRDKRAAALLKEAKLEEQHRRTIDFAIADEFIGHLGAVLFFAELDRLAQEFPANLKGKKEMEIHEEVLRQIKSIKRNIENGIEAWRARTRGKSADREQADGTLVT